MLLRSTRITYLFNRAGRHNYHNPVERERAEAAETAFRIAYPWWLPLFVFFTVGWMITGVVGGSLLISNAGSQFVHGYWPWATILKLVFVGAVVSMWVFACRRLRMAHQQQVSHPTCATCGYRLLHCPGRCPECGRPTCR